MQGSAGLPGETGPSGNLGEKVENVSDCSAAKIRVKNHWGDKILVTDHLLSPDKATICVAISENRDVLNGKISNLTDCW